MKRNDDMHRSLFSDPLSRNSTEDLDKSTLEYRKLSQKEIVKEAISWLKDGFYVQFAKDRDPSFRLKLTDSQLNSTIGCLVERLEELIENKKDIPPDFLAGLQSALGDIRTCSCCGPMSRENEALLTEKAEKAMELLQ